MPVCILPIMALPIIALRDLSWTMGCRRYGLSKNPADLSQTLPPAERITPSGSRHATVAIPSLGVLNLIEFEAPA